jgi:hypothetical protein
LRPPPARAGMEVHRQCGGAERSWQRSSNHFSGSGLKACPVCDSAESLGMSPYPAILVDGEFLLDPDALPEEEDGDLIFAVRIECTTCDHLMLFNARRYRTGDARIIENGITEEEGRALGRPVGNLPGLQ